MSKFDLTIEQYIAIIRYELSIRLSSKCGVRTVCDSIQISWDDWRYAMAFNAIKVYHDNGVPIEECVQNIICDAKAEFVKQL